MFDVVAVEFKTNKITIMASGKSERNAEAIEKMAIMRRGVENQFFSSVTAGSYKDGDIWEGIK